jgi:hypothetical protein
MWRINIFLKQTYEAFIFYMSCVIWTSIYVTTFVTTKILQRKWDIYTKNKAIERGSKKIIWVWERKLSQKLSKMVIQISFFILYHVIVNTLNFVYSAFIFIYLYLLIKTILLFWCSLIFVVLLSKMVIQKLCYGLPFMLCSFLQSLFHD